MHTFDNFPSITMKFHNCNYANLKGVHLKELQALLDFIYYGEVYVEQESLNDFLKVTEELAIKGMTTNTKKQEKLVKNEFQTPKAAKKPKTVLPQTSTSSADSTEATKPLLANIKAELEPELEPGPSELEPGAEHDTQMEETYDFNSVDEGNSSYFGTEGFGQYLDTDGNALNDPIGK